MSHEFTKRERVRILPRGDQSDNQQVRPGCLKKENTSMKNLRPKNQIERKSLQFAFITSLNFI